jgi:pilus assembly protein CpaB
MNRRTRHLVVLMIAIVTASIASFGVYRAMAQMPAQRVDAMTQVVVAAKPMVIGTSITSKDVKLVAWPASSLVPGAITDVKAAVDRGLLTSVLENEPLTNEKLAPIESGAGLSPAIPAGMRAISVRVNDVIGVAGFIVPGSRVDVVVTIRRPNDSMTRTAANNVQVLTAGTRKDQENPDASTKRLGDSGETVVTLMVTPRDAERIALAQSEGQIMLVLRNPLDTDTALTAGIKTDALLGSEPPATPPAPPAPVVRAAAPRPPAPLPEPVVAPPAPPPAAPSVEAIRAGKRTDEVIK